MSGPKLKQGEDNQSLPGYELWPSHKQSLWVMYHVYIWLSFLTVGLLRSVSCIIKLLQMWELLNGRALSLINSIMGWWLRGQWWHFQRAPSVFPAASLCWGSNPSGGSGIKGAYGACLTVDPWFSCLQQAWPRKKATVPPLWVTFQLHSREHPDGINVPP